MTIKYGVKTDDRTVFITQQRNLITTLKPAIAEDLRAIITYVNRV